jgi:hypothetical protein
VINLSNPNMVVAAVVRQGELVKRVQ